MNKSISEGYLHPLYAESFSEIGTPMFLPKSKGWLIKRPIADTNYFDAIGTYPLFFCQNWDGLLDDFRTLADELVSISLVLGPFSNYPIKEFQESFDLLTIYKDHYILDLSLPFNETVSKNKRRNARRALRDLNVELSVAPNINLDEWMSLYDCLIERHSITGIRKFSRESFAKQISIPNTHYFRVLHNERIVGGNLFYIQGDVAYAHLSAFTKEGYDLGASYAVKKVALKHLKNIVNYVNFGGSTGKTNGKNDGLDLFKQGWSNIIKHSYFAGKILNLEIYNKITTDKGKINNPWFPAYRSNDY